MAAISFLSFGFYFFDPFKSKTPGLTVYRNESKMQTSQNQMALISEEISEMP